MKESTDTLFAQMPTMDTMRGQLVNRTRGDKYIWGFYFTDPDFHSGSL